jgi:DNA invertase Pin-like site-specific DNA recombinase
MRVVGYIRVSTQEQAINGLEASGATIDKLALHIVNMSDGI